MGQSEGAGCLLAPGISVHLACWNPSRLRSSGSERVSRVFFQHQIFDDCSHRRCYPEPWKTEMENGNGSLTQFVDSSMPSMPLPSALPSSVGRCPSSSNRLSLHSHMPFHHSQSAICQTTPSTSIILSFSTAPRQHPFPSNITILHSCCQLQRPALIQITVPYLISHHRPDKRIPEFRTETASVDISHRGEYWPVAIDRVAE